MADVSPTAARIALIVSAAAAVAFRSLSDFDFSTLGGPFTVADLLPLTLNALALILQRDRFFLTVYSVVGTIALSAVLSALFLALRRRLGADWSLTTSLVCAMLTPVAVSVVAALRLIVRP